MYSLYKFCLIIFELWNFYYYLLRISKKSSATHGSIQIAVREDILVRDKVCRSLPVVILESLQITQN